MGVGVEIKKSFATPGPPKQKKKAAPDPLLDLFDITPPKPVATPPGRAAAPRGGDMVQCHNNSVIRQFAFCSST